MEPPGRAGRQESLLSGHSTAMFLGQALKDPKIIQRYLYHKDVRTTVEIYAGVADDQLKGAIKQS